MMEIQTALPLSSPVVEKYGTLEHRCEEASDILGYIHDATRFLCAEHRLSLIFVQ
jgi:hypothetical protein